MSETARRALAARKAQLFHGLRQLGRRPDATPGLRRRIRTAIEVLDYLSRHHDADGVAVTPTGQPLTANQIARETRLDHKAVKRSLILLAGIRLVAFTDIRAAGRRIIRRIRTDAFSLAPISPLKGPFQISAISPLKGPMISPLKGPLHIDPPPSAVISGGTNPSRRAAVSAAGRASGGREEEVRLAALAEAVTPRGASPPNPPAGNGAGPCPAAGEPAWKRGLRHVLELAQAASERQAAARGEAQAAAAQMGELRALFRQLRAERDFEREAPKWRERCATAAGRERVAGVIWAVRGQVEGGRKIRSAAGYLERAWQAAAGPNPVPE